MLFLSLKPTLGLGLRPRPNIATGYDKVYQHLLVSLHTLHSRQVRQKFCFHDFDDPDDPRFPQNRHNCVTATFSSVLFGFGVKYKLEHSKKRFSYTTLKAWNEIPMNIRELATLHQYKKRLKSYLTS